MENKAFLDIAGLSKTYQGFTALHPLNLKVREGEFLTIVGPSGSGKTTLIKLLVGMEELTDGTISLRGERLDLLPANHRPTCMVFQSLALFPHRNVGENIEFSLKIKGVDPQTRKTRAEELLTLFRLPLDFYYKRISECSGGERQRIALARALAFDPEILFFDEPLSALDYRLRKTLEKELKELHARTGKTFVYITHSLEEAMVMSDRIAILRNGRFEQIAPAHDIYSKPVSRFVAEFMGDVNLFSIDAATANSPVPIAGIDRSTISSWHWVDDDGGSSAAGSTTTNAADSQRSNTLLMVRPEHLSFLQPQETAEFEIDGVISAEYMLGSRTQYKVRSAAGQELSVERSSSGVPYRTDQPVRLGFARDHAHLIREPRS